MSDSPTVSPLIILVADDLMFPSRVREGLKPLGYSLKVSGSQESLRTLVSGESQIPAAILVQLTARRYDPLSVIRELKDDSATAAIPLLAFAGHVEKEKHDAARLAGADMVAANSSVALHLAALLARLLSGEKTVSDADKTE